MSMYDLPKLKPLKKKINIPCFNAGKNQTLKTIFLSVSISLIVGFLAGTMAVFHFYPEPKEYFQENAIETAEPIIIQEEIKEPIILPIEPEKLDALTHEQAIIQVFEGVSPSVVSIVVTKYLPVWERWHFFEFPQHQETRVEPREIGWGSGFIVSKDGLVVTNRHVVLDKDAEYTVVTADGEKFPAEVLGRDPLYDLAILKIQAPDKKFLPVRIADFPKLQPGQTVIAIGNALGELRNTISTGVISGLGRTITARGGGMIITLEDVIQTDAAINPGNSGGPLLNLRGEVIGINTAMAIGAENIGFAIPIDKAQRAISQVKTYGRILHPFLGVCWTQITPGLQQELGLPKDYGVLIQAGRGCLYAIFPNSAAYRAGLQEGDIILEWNKEKLVPENSLGRVIQRHVPGDEVSLKILRQGQEKIIKVILGEREL